MSVWLHKHIGNVFRSAKTRATVRLRILPHMVNFNESWKQISDHVKRAVIVADREFYCRAVDLFTITVVDDETGKNEFPYQTVVEQSYATLAITSPYNLIGFFLHVTSHQRCDVFWEKCPVNMDSFTSDQLDFIEEVYNQRLVSIVAPEYFSHFPQLCDSYDRYKQFNQDNRRALQTMFTKTSKAEHIPLDDVHQWLYNSDPLSQQTFNGYMRLWQLLVTEPTVKLLLEKYEQN